MAIRWMSLYLTVDKSILVQAMACCHQATSHYLSQCWPMVSLGHNELSHWSRDKNGGHFPADIFKCIFLNENAWISIKISLQCVPEGPIHNIPELVQIMTWRRPSDKPLSEPMRISLLMHICVTRPEWVNFLAHGRCGSNSIQAGKLAFARSAMRVKI